MAYEQKGIVMDKKQIEQLRQCVADNAVSLEHADRIVHSYDATQKQFLPDAVVYVSSAQEISAVIRWANDQKIPVIPRGAGSGFSGGSLPVTGGIVLVLTSMNRILEIDEENLVAVVEPGVVTAELQRTVEQLGLFYPPDPASKEFSTLGGNVAECAGGPRCLKYGVTRDYVLGLEVVLPTGEIITTGGRTLKNVVGYDLTRLFVGSEGTLGIVTQIILKLLPKPEAKKTMLAQFKSIDGAAKAVSAIIGGKILPTTLEFMDRTTISCVRKNSPIPLPDSCEAVLIIEVDGERQHLDGQMENIQEIIKKLDILNIDVAATHDESERIWQVRRSVSPSLRAIKPDKFNEDIVVPRSRVPEMIRALETISKKYEVAIVNFGHAGDGNIHVNIMVDLQEPGMRQKIELVIEEVFQTAINLQGSISGEHGIGTAKSRYIAKELGPDTLACMQRIKKTFDPNNILNPGKIFPGTSTPHQNDQGSL